jgi:hypothetical protein
MVLGIERRRWGALVGFGSAGLGGMRHNRHCYGVFFRTIAAAAGGRPGRAVGGAGSEDLAAKHHYDLTGVLVLNLGVVAGPFIIIAFPLFFLGKVRRK